MTVTPTVSLVLLAYRQEAFVEAALRAALSQDPPPLEVIVNDDGSSDATAAVIERVLADHRGPVQTRFIRNPSNVGLAASFNNAVAQASGDIVMGAAGDDISMPSRCGAVAEAFGQDPDLQCVSSNAEVIDENGHFVRLWHATPTHPRTVRSFLNANEGLLGATVAFRRSLFDRFGPLDPDLQVEDRVIPLRAAMAGRVGYIDRPLVRYRQHGNNIWMGHARSAAPSMRDFAVYLARENAMMLPVFRNRLRDLETGLRCFPERRNEIAVVLQATTGFLCKAQLEATMWKATGSGARLRATLRAFAGGIRGKAAWRWIKLFYLPRLYHRGIRRRHQPA